MVPMNMSEPEFPPHKRLHPDSSEGEPSRKRVNTFIPNHVEESYPAGIQLAPWAAHHMQIPPPNPPHSHNMPELTQRYPETFGTGHFIYEGQAVKPYISSANMTPVYLLLNPPPGAYYMAISQSAPASLSQKPLFRDPLIAPPISMPPVMAHAANSARIGYPQSSSLATHPNPPWPPLQPPNISQPPPPPRLLLPAGHAPSVRVGSELNTYAIPPSIPLTNEAIQRGAEEAFIELIPAINKVDSNNFGDLLVLVVKKHGHNIPLDDFYNVLYNPRKLDPAPGSLLSPKIDKTKPPNEIGLRLCHLILEIFKIPGASPSFVAPFGTGLVDNKLLALVNYHELLRSFLAIKIMMDSLRTVDPIACPITIPRISIYKVYYIFCQKLICKYKNGRNSGIALENLILCQSRIGKLTKWVFPDLIAKRLGKRGESKYHYLGLAWNTALVSNEIFRLLDFDLSQLREHFRSSKEKPLPDLKTPTKASVQDIISVGSASTLPRKSWPSDMRPPHSYVDKSIIYPNTNCSPRVWEVTPDSIPAQSQWAQDSIEQSMRFLNHHSPEVEQKLRNLNAGIFFEETQLWQVVQESLTMLRNMHMPGEAFLHFFLIMLLRIFPMVLASDQELNFPSKFKLRSALNRCIDGLKHEIARFCPRDAINVRNFLSFLVKMVRLSEITSLSVNSESLPDVVRAFVADVELLEDPSKENYDEELTLETSFANAIILSMRAYKFDIASISPNGGKDNGIEAIYHVARNLEVGVRKVINTLKQNVAAIEKGEASHMPSDIPYQVFRLLSEVIHEDCLRDPVVSKLPICIMTFLVLHITTVLQKVSLDEFRNRERDLSRETFKTWWVFSTTLQEYMKIIAEIVALSQRLNKDPAD